MPLAMPSSVDVPAGVNSDRNVLLMRSHRTEMQLADQIRALRETDGVVTYLPLQASPSCAAGFIFTYLPPCRGEQ